MLYDKLDRDGLAYINGILKSKPDDVILTIKSFHDYNSETIEYPTLFLEPCTGDFSTMRYEASFDVDVECTGDNISTSFYWDGKVPLHKALLHPVGKAVCKFVDKAAGCDMFFHDATPSVLVTGNGVGQHIANVLRTAGYVVHTVPSDAICNTHLAADVVVHTSKADINVTAKSMLINLTGAVLSASCSDDYAPHYIDASMVGRETCNCLWENLDILWEKCYV